jgi:hypothetical protein
MYERAQVIFVFTYSFILSLFLPLMCEEIREVPRAQVPPFRSISLILKFLIFENVKQAERLTPQIYNKNRKSIYTKNIFRSETLVNKGIQNFNIF